MFLLPKLAIAGLILLGGVWLSQYLGRSMLVWAVNEDFPSPRRLAAVVRIMIVFVAVVVAAYQLDFAERVFLAAFVILVGAVALAASIAGGLTLRSVLERSLRGKHESEEAGREVPLEPPVMALGTSPEQLQDGCVPSPGGPAKTVALPFGTAA